MMMKTHLAAGFALAFFLIPNVTHKFSFFIVVLIASLIPDIDISNSHIGNKWYFRPLQLFVKHRGIIHSLTFCIFISIVLSFFIPVIALPFFVGYSLHLIMDSFTIDGIRPFWPFKNLIAGKVRSGGKMEEIIFVVFAIIDVILMIKLFI